MRTADFIGYWKITKMDEWDQDYVDLVVPGFIEFEMEDDHLLGSFQFGTVSGSLDCRLRDGGAETAVEWSWEGRSDSDPGLRSRLGTTGRHEVGRTPVYPLRRRLSL